MSDTPISDASIAWIECEDSCCAIFVRVSGEPCTDDLVPLGVARDLERKLALCRVALENAYQVHRAITTYSEQSNEDKLANEAHCRMMQRALTATEPTP